VNFMSSTVRAAIARDSLLQRMMFTAPVLTEGTESDAALSPEETAATSIIPSPGPRPTIAPTTEEISVPGEFQTFTLGADRIFYATDLPTALRVGLGTTITNNGTVWLETSRPQVFFVVGSQPAITNSGTIFLRGEVQVALNNGADRITNTGNIFAISNAGWARVVQAGRFAVVDNSGVIAAQTLQSTPLANSGNATAIDSFNGAVINNRVGGQILAEAGDRAVAIQLGGPNGDTGEPSVTNRGLIAAAATSANGTSFGILAPNGGNTVVNFGTIRAQFAIAGVSNLLNAVGGVIEGLVVTQTARDVIENNGRITGNVFTESGDDVFSGTGVVEGFVDMGEGNDTFSGEGRVSRFVDMGWGNDTFLGSALADVATGNRGSDTMSGFGGNDLLLGGFGNDEISGGSGNDGLFGEYGDDLIIVEGGDFVEGGSGVDRIELRDYAFASINGGSGFDILAMADGARNFRLDALVAGQRLSGIDAIELRGNQQLAIDSASIAKLSDDTTSFLVVGNASDRVHLAGTWTRLADLDGYQRWQQGAFTVLVTANTPVSINSAPAFGGLDAVAGGEAAPRPGAAAGLNYTPREIFVSDYVIEDPAENSDSQYQFVVDSEEIFFTVGTSFVFRAGETLAALVNDGAIVAVNDETYLANGVTLGRQMGFVDFINNGLLVVEANGPAGGGGGVSFVSVGASVEGRVINRGEINVFSRGGNVLGVEIRTQARGLNNSGDVIAISASNAAVGVTGDGTDVFGNQAFFNTGLIYAEGVNVSDPSIYNPVTTHPVTGAVAVGFRGGGNLTNGGLIIAAVGANAVAGARSVGVATFPGSGESTTVINNGEIRGTIAVFFYGAGGNTLDNNGLLVGDVWFAQGNDVFDNSGGVARGTVFGFGGNDSLTGGREADRFNGGLGDDVLNGGANIDTAIVRGARSEYTITQTSTGVF
jgi:hypothetical protein